MATMIRPARLRVALLASGLAVAATSHGDLARAEEPRARVARAPVPLDGVVAIVDDVTIFRSDVATRIRRLESTLSKDPRERRREIAELEKGMVARLVDETLIRKDAAKLYLLVTDAEVSAAIGTVAAANKMDRQQLDVEVAKAGYSPTEYQDEVRRQILEQKWLVARAMRLIDRKKAADSAALEAAFEKQRKILLLELREHAYVEIR
jgi:parvulin-like peptidyl-prolyl isomerase